LRTVLVVLLSCCW